MREDECAERERGGWGGNGPGERTPRPSYSPLKPPCVPCVHACSHDIVITNGANQAYMNLVLALVDSGDKVVLFRPAYFDHLMVGGMTGWESQLWGWLPTWGSQLEGVESGLSLLRGTQWPFSLPRRGKPSYLNPDPSGGASVVLGECDPVILKPSTLPKYPPPHTHNTHTEPSDDGRGRLGGFGRVRPGDPQTLGGVAEGGARGRHRPPDQDGHHREPLKPHR